MRKFGKIISVAPGSIAHEIGLAPGDSVASINGESLLDIIDVSFAFAEESIDLEVIHEDGEREFFSFDKDYDEELGVEFESAVFDALRGCGNKCAFCFVDQSAPGMRKGVYVKDDDYRLSFLYGNFITLTNMTDADFERIRALHLSPLFVSVHTTNMRLRARLMGTERAARLFEELDRLEDAGTEYHAQVVLCPGINDGDELTRTIRDMSARPGALSLAVVPVGLTRYRDGCFPLSSFDADGAARVIRQVREFQEACRKKNGENFVYLADEFYLMAGVEVPGAEEYDGFPQLDNGIGLTRIFIDEWEGAIRAAKIHGYGRPLILDVVCGTAIAPIFERLIATLSVPNLTVRIVPVVNEFFGDSVNVSGLLTGRDILAALARVGEARDGVILPRCAVREGDDIFLDDYALSDFQEKIGAECALALGGEEIFHLLTRWDERKMRERRTGYMWQQNAAYTRLEP